MQDTTLGSLSRPSGRSASRGAASAELAEPERSLRELVRWLVQGKPPVRERWDSLWAQFQPDGTMHWSDFENCVRWNFRWAGDARRAFEALEADECGLITTRALLEARRRYERAPDLGKMDSLAGIDGLRRLLIGQYGSVGRAWRIAFDPEDSGRACQPTFIRACQNLGFRGNLKSTWAELTCHEAGRHVGLGDLDPEADRLLAFFVAALVERHGGHREGWSTVIRAAGGQLEQTGFQELCRQLGLSARESRRIFLCLDREAHGAVSEPEHRFLGLWAPEPADCADPPMPPREGPAPLKLSGSAGSLGVGGKAGSAANGAAFEFVVVLTREEHNEYLRRKRESQFRPMSPGRTPSDAWPTKAASGSLRPRSTGARPRVDPAATSGGGGWASLAPPAADRSHARATSPCSSLGSLLQMTVPT